MEQCEIQKLFIYMIKLKSLLYESVVNTSKNWDNDKFFYHGRQGDDNTDYKNLFTDNVYSYFTRTIEAAFAYSVGYEKRYWEVDYDDDSEDYIKYKLQLYPIIVEAKLHLNGKKIYTDPISWRTLDSRDSKIDMVDEGYVAATNIKEWEGVPSVCVFYPELIEIVNITQMKDFLNNKEKYYSHFGLDLGK